MLALELGVKVQISVGCGSVLVLLGAVGFGGANIHSHLSSSGEISISSGSRAVYGVVVLGVVDGAVLGLSVAGGAVAVGVVAVVDDAVLGLSVAGGAVAVGVVAVVAAGLIAGLAVVAGFVDGLSAVAAVVAGFVDGLAVVADGVLAVVADGVAGLVVAGVGAVAGVAAVTLLGGIAELSGSVGAGGLLGWTGAATAADWPLSGSIGCCCLHQTLCWKESCWSMANLSMDSLASSIICQNGKPPSNGGGFDPISR